MSKKQPSHSNETSSNASRRGRPRPIRERDPDTGGGFMINAMMSMSQARQVTAGQEERYPPLLTYGQAADLAQVSVSTLKGWFSEGKYADCVRRGKPGRVLRDKFVKEFMKDDFSG